MTVTINGTTGYTGPIGAIGDLSTTGNTTLGDAAGDTLTINGSTTTFTQGTANGVAYLNGSKVLTTGSALVFDGTNLGIGTASPTQKITANGSIRLTGNSSNFNETGAQIDSYDGLRLASYISTGSAIQFLTNASGGNTAERARIDAAGNLGLGVTPNTWNNNFKAFQFGSAGALAYQSGTTAFWLGSNWYYNSGDKYITTGNATLYSQQTGQHVWWTAGSGTAGNAISFTQAMTLDASGNLGVGVTNNAVYPYGGKLNINGSASFVNADSRIGWGISDSFTLNGTTVCHYGMSYGPSSGNFVTLSGYSGLVFATSGAQRARINSSGGINVNTGTRSSVIGPNDTTAGQLFLTNAGTTGGSPDYQTWPQVYLFNSSSNAGAGVNMTLRCNLSTSYGAYIAFDVNGVAGWSVGTLSSNQNFYINADWASITGTGGVYLTHGSPSSWQTFSDERMKTIVRPIENALEKVKKIRKVVGYYTKDKTKTLVPFFIAQDFLEALPEVVDNSDAQGYGMSYQGTIPLLAAAIEELAKQFEEYRLTHP